MYMIMFVLDDPDQLDQVLEAWEERRHSRRDDRGKHRHPPRCGARTCPCATCTRPRRWLKKAM